MGKLAKEIGYTQPLISVWKNSKRPISIKGIRRLKEYLSDKHPITPTANIIDTTNVIALATTYTDTAGNSGTTASSANYALNMLYTLCQSTIDLGDY